MKVNQSKLTKLVEVLEKKEIEKILFNERVINERTEIISTFIYNLALNVTSTYLGKEYIKTNNDYIGHFRWCFSKTNSVFLLQEINFEKNNELFDYLYEYFLSSLYENDEYQEDYILSYWMDLFDLTQRKIKIDMDIYIDIYYLFNTIFIEKLYE